jgi:hypothetical protein
MRIVRALVALAALGMLASGCSSEDKAAATVADKVKPLDASFVPDKLLGYPLSPEKTDNRGDVERSYIEAVRLYSLRDGDQLVATLEVGRFVDGVEWNKRAFQRGVLNQIGASKPNRLRLGEDTVFATAGVKQRLAVWFRDGYLFVLGTRDEFTKPRTLLREALEIQP